eukprot:TRINITY_DN8353_c0_g1_i2.p2 TRINITY_DN8353_c0_g1~~TRINITY_DN8353_c0_g1_i2.p2  ORF type:complete len:255 (+),score=91.89 TRINITY_DN8353_c0_g1_i2:176-940(+)
MVKKDGKAVKSKKPGEAPLAGKIRHLLPPALQKLPPSVKAAAAEDEDSDDDAPPEEVTTRTAAAGPGPSEAAQEGEEEAEDKDEAAGRAFLAELRAKDAKKRQKRAAAAEEAGEAPSAAQPAPAEEAGAAEEGAEEAAKVERPAKKVKQKTKTAKAAKEPFWKEPENQALLEQIRDSDEKRRQRRLASSRVAKDGVVLMHSGASAAAEAPRLAADFLQNELFSHRKRTRSRGDRFDRNVLGQARGSAHLMRAKA